MDKASKLGRPWISLDCRVHRFYTVCTTNQAFQSKDLHGRWISQYAWTSCRKKYSVEELDGEKIVKRRPGVTARTCVKIALTAQSGGSGDLEAPEVPTSFPRPAIPSSCGWSYMQQPIPTCKFRKIEHLQSRHQSVQDLIFPTSGCDHS